MLKLLLRLTVLFVCLIAQVMVVIEVGCYPTEARYVVDYISGLTQHEQNIHSKCLHSFIKSKHEDMNE